MIKMCDNLVLYHIHNYVHYDSYIYDLSVLVFEREENRSARRKTLEAQERSTTTTGPTHMKRKSRPRVPRLGLTFFGGERQPVLPYIQQKSCEDS